MIVILIVLLILIVTSLSIAVVLAIEHSGKLIKKIVKSKRQLNYPLIQTYLMNDALLKNEWIDEVSESTHKYILTKERKEESDQYEIHIKKVTNDKLKDFIKANEAFAIVFSNKNETFKLEIANMKFTDGNVVLSINKTKLSALNPLESACLICNTKDRPAEFAGSFKSNPIVYKIEGSVTKEIYPTLSIKKHRFKK